MDNTVGIVGSPSSTAEIAVDILEGAEGGSLLGQLVALPHRVEDGYAIAIGTVSEIVTRNRWHEDQNMRGVLKQHGALPHLSEVGDVRTATMRVQAAYRCELSDPREGSEPTEIGAALPMSPATGASVIRVTDDYLGGLLRRHKEETVYLGHAYNMADVRLPLTIRHFGPVAEGGAGEAYHSGIFGMTGSGKSAFAAYVLAAHFRHRDLAIIVMDPQGQFTSEEGVPVPLSAWASHHGRQVQKYSISRDLQLPQDASVLMSLLSNTRFFRDILTIRNSTNRESAVAEFERILRDQTGWNDMSSDDLLVTLLRSLVNDQQALHRIYTTEGPQERLRITIERIIDNENDREMALELFRPLHSLFTHVGRRSILHILQEALDPKSTPRPLIIIDFSASTSSESEGLLETTPVKAHILRIVCRHLNRLSEEAYRKGGTLNTLVVFDEAQRFAANDPDEGEPKELVGKLVDYVRTTRKYGLGWMFITQEAGSLHRSIYSQLRFRAFGYGLTSGSELQRLRETIGDQSALDLYRSFVDPVATTPARYPFMLEGPISPLSFAGTPLFLSVYTDFEQFKTDNGYRPPAHA